MPTDDDSKQSGNQLILIMGDRTLTPRMIDSVQAQVVDTQVVTPSSVDTSPPIDADSDADKSTLTTVPVTDAVTPTHRG